ncbi:Psf2p [Malassezia vespertilionis]|uniref:DNA replication complex GINS protein PSF2 n=1 Tax=Malassezia vespertilionis TaxID=2020962 RepID=A0A2N1JCP9_9BASI|nr:Psf2p [Malassezia vespertilionis]
MALPAAAHHGILPTEMEYLASCETHISILPLISIDRFRLLSGTYGPFRPPAHAHIPLWLALSLRKKRKCVIIPPDWLSVDTLSEYLRQEVSSLPFAPLPLHYIPISKLLLDSAAEDIPQSARVRSLLKDLADARQSKVLTGMTLVNPIHLEMTNISSLEIAQLRPFFATALKQLQAIHAEPHEEASLSQTAEPPAEDTEIAVRHAHGASKET